MLVPLCTGIGQAASDCGDGWRKLGQVTASQEEGRHGFDIEDHGVSEIRFGAHGGAVEIQHVHLSFEQLGEWRLGQVGTLQNGEFSKAYPIPREYRDFRSISMEARSPNTKTKVLVCGR